MFFWGQRSLLVNAYVTYTSFMEQRGRKILSHYNFYKKIVLANVSPLTGPLCYCQGDNSAKEPDQAVCCIWSHQGLSYSKEEKNYFFTEGDACGFQTN